MDIQAPQNMLSEWFVNGGHDVAQAIRRINPSVSTDDVKRHEAWMKSFGST